MIESRSCDVNAFVQRSNQARISFAAAISLPTDAVSVCASVVMDASAVIGYYALLAGELDHGEATKHTRKGMSRHYPIAVAILARLAVDRRPQHRGLGAMLLRDALERVVLASEQLAVRAVVVHATDQARGSLL